MSMHMKCPQCQAQANILLDEARRWRLYCVTCGLDTYLKRVADLVKARQDNCVREFNS
jgi:Zn ribbon nucleic-acid-binding protein